ncbi:MAG: DM13 domain-containing protein [Gammaproteobacteria bacterium]
MTKRRSILVSVAIVAGGLLWYLFRPDALVLTRTVNEPFPAAERTSSMTASSEMAHSAMANESGMHEPSAAEPVKLVAGRFHSNAHETRGAATIYRLDDGRQVLRLTEFTTSNGPDVRVYLVAAADVQEEDAAKQAGFVDLGPLKGNIGDQNYDVAEGLDLTKYRAVSIWCRRFSVNFGAAPLTDGM